MFKSIGKMFSKIFHRSNKDEFSEEQLKKMKTYKDKKKRKIPQGKRSHSLDKHHDMLHLHNRRKKRKIRNRIARKSRQINRKAA